MWSSIAPYYVFPVRGRSSRSATRRSSSATRHVPSWIEHGLVHEIPVSAFLRPYIIESYERCKRGAWQECMPDASPRNRRRHRHQSLLLDCFSLTKDGHQRGRSCIDLQGRLWWLCVDKPYDQIRRPQPGHHMTGGWSQGTSMLTERVRDVEVAEMQPVLIL